MLLFCQTRRGAAGYAGPSSTEVQAEVTVMKTPYLSSSLSLTIKVLVPSTGRDQATSLHACATSQAFWKGETQLCEHKAL